MADEELFRNLAARLVFRNQSQNAPFGGREVFQFRLSLSERGGALLAIEKVARQRGADVMLTGSDGFDAVDYIGERAFLKHIAFRAEIDGLVEKIFLAVNGQKDYLDAELLLTKSARHAEAVHLRHVNIEHSDIGTEPSDLLKRRAPIPGFRHYL